MALQGVLGLLDVGFSQIMPRDFARVAGDAEAEARTYAAYARIYAALAVTGFAVAQFAAGPAARHWFHVSADTVGRLELALRLVAVQFLFQFAGNVNTGYWNGLERQVRANVRQAAFSTVRYLGALAVVYWLWRNVFGYLAVFVAVSFSEWAWNRHSIRTELRQKGAALRAPTGSQIVAIGREAGGFTVGILVGVLVSQMDRIVLSATQDLTRYGYYVIGANVALMLLSLQIPVTRAYLPRMVRNGSEGSLLLWLLVVGVIPTALFGVFAREILSAWLRNPEIVRAIAVPFQLLLVGVILNLAYQLVYLRLFVAGSSRAVLGINLVCLLATGTAAALLGTGTGLALGGILWIVNGTVQVTLGWTWWWFWKRRVA
jgi:O-antigen/teichoic acid export membrane protein